MPLIVAKTNVINTRWPTLQFYNAILDESVTIETTHFSMRAVYTSYSQNFDHCDRYACALERNDARTDHGIAEQSVPVPQRSVSVRTKYDV